LTGGCISFILESFMKPTSKKSTVMRYFICWILLFISSIMIAQDASIGKGDQLLEKAYHYEEGNSLDSAIFYFQKAGIFFKEEEDWQKYIECLSGENRNYLRTDRIGDIAVRAAEVIQLVNEGKAEKVDASVIEVYTHFARYYWYAKGNFQEALRHLDEAIRLCEAAAFNTDELKIPIYTNYGYTYGYSGDFDQSSRYFENALTLSIEIYGAESEQAADRYTDMVFPLIQKSEWEKAEIALKKALELNIRIRGAEHISVLKTYNNLGYIYLTKFDNDQAILYINKAMDLIHQQYGEGHRSIGIGYMNLGASYFNKGDYDNCIRFSKKALNNLRTSIGTKNPYMGIVLLNTALAYNYLSQPDSAEIYFDKALQLKLDLYGTHHMEIVNTYGQISDFYLKNQEYELAREAIFKAMDIAKDVMPAKHKLTGENYYFLAEYYAKTGRLEESLKASQKGLIALVPSFEDEKIMANPELVDVISTITLLDVCIRKCITLSELYEQNKNQDILNVAFNTVKVTDKALDILRNEYQTPDSKELLLLRSKGFYENAISIALKLNDLTKEEEYLREAFRYIEKSKSILLFENMKSKMEYTYFNLPDSLGIEEQSLSRAIDFYKEKIFEASNNNDTTKLAHYENVFFQKKRDYDLLLNVLKAEYPDYYSINHDISTVTLEEVRNQLDDESVMIEFFYGEKHIYALAITRNQISPVIIPNSKELKNLVMGITRDIGERKFDPKAYHQMYKMLIKPLESNFTNATHLTVVPDGPLHYVPFEIFITSDMDAATKEYLVHRYTINYLHSLSLPEIYKNQGSTYISYLGISPEYNKAGNPLLASRSARDIQIGEALEKLPMAEQEIKKSASIWNGESLYNENATEENFKKYARDAGIIHIASHAIIDDEDPMNSKLVFSSGEDMQEDGLLHTYELYNMQLNAQLACLSACNTGFGQIKSGEGVVSLAKGFFYAGVPNVLMSLWSVPDRSTSEIITYFYEELKKGAGKSDALRNAKLKYLESADANTSNPYYWAAFTMIGDNEPLHLENKFPWWIAGLSLLLIFILLYYFMK